MACTELCSLVIRIDLMLFLFYFMQSILESVGPTHNIDSLHEGYISVTRRLWGFVLLSKIILGGCARKISVNGARKSDLYIIIYTSLYGVCANAEKEKRQ